MTAHQGWHVYILECADGTLYTGVTNDLDNRITAHNAGKGAKYTRSRLPVKLIYRETTTDRSSALRRELSIKNLSRADKLGLIAEPSNDQQERRTADRESAAT